MAYERITLGNGYRVKEKDVCGLSDKNGDGIHFPETYNRLAELEDKIESGLLVELPCKVGDKVYGVDKNISRIIHGTVVYFAVNSELTVFMDDDDNHTYWVKYVFTTKEAAEAKLKELRGQYEKTNRKGEETVSQNAG